MSTTVRRTYYVEERRLTALAADRGGEYRSISAFDNPEDAYADLDKWVDYEQHTSPGYDTSRLRVVEVTVQTTVRPVARPVK